MSRRLNELSESENLIRLLLLLVIIKVKRIYLDNDIVEHVETFTTDAQWDEWVENSNKSLIYLFI